MRSLMKWALDWPAFAQAGDEDDRENRDAKQLGDGFRARRPPFVAHAVTPCGWRGSSAALVVRIKGNRIAPDSREDPVVGWIRNWLHAVRRTVGFVPGRQFANRDVRFRARCEHLGRFAVPSHHSVSTRHWAFQPT